ncbi:MAG: class I SAM-dependent methyltransferase [Propioniciclava sp.]|uniref:class I SAM-dependent methyltransferase n=1 Tax=Propioniciclava sp. TaxID=2038686 RepID=UPI0039E29974
MTDQHATSFGQASDLYENSRPTYPAEAVTWLVGEAAEVVDVGAGTGKLTRGLLGAGCRVTAVDPDQAMLGVLAQGLPGVTTHLGSAESLPLPDASADLITFGQAWHWVDVPSASRECARVLRPGGALGLIWNVRDESVDWIAAMTVIVTASKAERMVADGTVRVGEEFGALAERSWSWSRTLTPEVIVELMASRSAVIMAAPEERARVLGGVTDLLANHPDLAGRDTIEVPYRTYAYRAIRT